MATTMLQAAGDRVVGHLAVQQGVQVSEFAPEILELAAKAMLAVIEACLDGRRDEEVVAAMRSPGLMEMFAVRRAVREVLYDRYGPLSFRRYGGSALSEAIIAAGREASDEERLALLAEASGRVST